MCDVLQNNAGLEADSLLALAAVSSSKRPFV